MSRSTWRRSPQAARLLVCCCLFVALPWDSFAGLLASILGPVHFHVATAVAAAADPMAGWQDFRRTDHVGDSTYHVHDHAMPGRHHHAVGDGSVVTIGADGQDGGSEAPETSGSATVMVLAAGADGVSLPLSPHSESDAGWRSPPACAFQNCDPRRLERPPTA